MTDQDRATKKEYLKNYYHKRKNLLNHLISCVEKLKNINLNRLSFSIFKSLRKIKKQAHKTF